MESCRVEPGSVERGGSGGSGSVGLDIQLGSVPSASKPCTIKQSYKLNAPSRHTRKQQHLRAGSLARFISTRFREALRSEDLDLKTCNQSQLKAVFALLFGLINHVNSIAH